MPVTKGISVSQFVEHKTREWKLRVQSLAITIFFLRPDDSHCEQRLGKNLVGATGKKELQLSMDRFTGYCNITETMLETSLNNTKSINERPSPV